MGGIFLLAYAPDSPNTIESFHAQPLNSLCLYQANGLVKAGIVTHTKLQSEVVF